MTDAPPSAPVRAPPARRALGRWLAGQRRVARAPLRRAAACAALAGALAVPQAWLLAHAIAAAVMAGAGLATLRATLVAIPFVIALRFALGQMGDRAALTAALAIKETLRTRLLRKMQALGPAWARGQRSGALATTVVDAVEALHPYYARFVPNLAVLATLPLTIAVLVLPRDWISGTVLLVTAPVIPLFMFLIGEGTQRLNQRQWRTLLGLSARLHDALARLTTIKLFNAVEREATLLARTADAYRRTTMAVLRVAFLSSLALEFFATVGIALVAVLVGFRLLDGAMTLEVGLFALLLAPEFYAPLRRLGADYHARMDALAAAESIAEVLRTAVPTRGRARPALPARIALRIDDVHFAYGTDAAALHGVSLAIEPGAMLALVGASGAGKSTLAALLAGELRPQRGRIVVAGHDLADLDPDFWLKHVATVPQRPFLLAGTIGDNLRLGRPDATDAEVEAAAHAASAGAFIAALPQGYRTVVGEQGRTLSGGEAQRLALARAFLKDAPIVLIDEGTTGLDPRTEDAIGAALARLARTRTIVVIAHRVRTVLAAARVAVLDTGRIVEQGPPRALLAARGPFAQLVARARLAPWDGI